MNISTIRQELGQLEGRLYAQPLRGERYARCLNSYEEASNQRQQILEWIARAVIPQFSADSMNVLSIGCGAGDLDKHILAAGAEHSATISYVGLEPDAAQCERFVNQMGFAEDENVQIRVHNSSFEELNDPKSYDLVLMVHSLYYMEDPAWAIEKALSLLKEDCQLIVLLAANDVLNELSSSFWQIETDRTAWYSQDLSAHLDRLSLAFTREQIKARLDVTPCFDSESATGSEIADFLAQVSMNELPDRLQRMIGEYLDATSHTDDAGRWLHHNVDAFSICAQAINRTARVANVA